MWRLVARIGAVALSIAVAAVAAGSHAPAAQAASGGVAYDEIAKTIMSGSGGGQPQPGNYVNGSFAADFQAAVNVGGPPKMGHGILNVIMHAQETANKMMAMLKNGIPSTHYFLNGWERNDDPVNQTAIIYRGDLGEKIQLDLAKKTYSITKIGELPEQTPPPVPPPSGQSGPQPSPEPGTAKMTVSASTAALGPKTIDDQPTNGYRMSFKLAVTQATGSCSNGSFATSFTEYISRYSEPAMALPNGKTQIRKNPMTDPQAMSVKPGCKPTITANTKTGPTPPAGKLALWTFMNMSGTMGAPQAQQGQGGANNTFGFLVERGNVRTLGSSDASLFEPPADFKKVDATN